MDPAIHEHSDDVSSLFETKERSALGRQAFNLHRSAFARSVQDGCPGFISDSHLHALAPQSRAAVVELRSAGLWSRQEGGYFIMVLDVQQRELNAARGYNAHHRWTAHRASSHLMPSPCPADSAEQPPLAPSGPHSSDL